mmetsp:Transcript_79/g.272  ORF Transcript_79/g.272 Transcript_79/m.272 type:complete len:254 (+) Transcript_79:552-1313(+)
MERGPSTPHARRPPRRAALQSLRHPLRLDLSQVLPAAAGRFAPPPRRPDRRQLRQLRLCSPLAGATAATAAARRRRPVRRALLMLLWPLPAIHSGLRPGRAHLGRWGRRECSRVGICRSLVRPRDERPRGPPAQRDDRRPFGGREAATARARATGAADGSQGGQRRAGAADFAPRRCGSDGGTPPAAHTRLHHTRCSSLTTGHRISILHLAFLGLPRARLLLLSSPFMHDMPVRYWLWGLRGLSLGRYGRAVA